MAAPPNIVFIMCDQFRHDCAGFAGHPTVRTPHLDRLAENGVVFENAYCASPVCSPARASWLTGLYPHAHEQLCNYGVAGADGKPLYTAGYRLRPECVTLGDALKRAGYRCGIVGPWHLGDDHRPQHGFEDFWCTSGYQSPETDRLLRDLAEQNVPSAPPFTDGGLRFRYALTSDPRQQRTTWAVDRGLDFIRARDPRPFFLFLSIKDPHPPMLVPPKWVVQYPVDRIDLPATWRNPLHGKPRYQHEDPFRTPGKVSDESYRRIVSHYYGLISHIDEELGRLVGALGENTLVVFFSDHGEMLGDHGFLGKMVMYESAARVPMVMSWPGTLPRDHRVQSPLGGVDLFPTLLDLAGVAQESPIVGRSVASAIGARREPEPLPIFAELCSWKAFEWPAEPLDLGARVMVNDGRFKLVWNANDADELYDLANDPDEMTNLASKSEETHRVSNLRKRILHMLQRTGPGVFSWCGRGM